MPEVLTTLTVQNDGSTATLSLIRKSDGSIEFVNVDGNTVRCHANIEMSKLFSAIEALV